MVINSNLGDVSALVNENYPSIASIIQMWIDNGELSNPIWHGELYYRGEEYYGIEGG